MSYGKHPRFLFLRNFYCQILALSYILLLAEASLALTRWSNSPGYVPEELLASEARISPRCRHDISLYVKHLQSGSDWATKMFDSTGKMESGVMMGGRTFLGLFSECLEALPKAAELSAPNKYSQHFPAFTSTYCLTSIHLHSEQGIDKQELVTSICNKLSGADITIGACVPSTCTEEDVSAIATFVLCEAGCSGNSTSTRCRRGIQALASDIPAVVVTIFIVLLLVIVITATVTDYTQNTNKKKEAMKLETRGKKATRDVATATRTESPFHKKAGKALLCFSLLQNSTELFQNKRMKGGSFDVLNGLRFFSSAGVISLHNRHVPGYITAFRNAHERYKGHLMTGIIDRGSQAVDTFLFIGAFLVGYNTLTHLRKNNSSKDWFLSCVHRYLRTMPLMMASAAFCAFLLYHLGDGPVWTDFVGTYQNACRDNWWTNLINLQNFIHTDNMCLPHTWYSAVDFQLFLISPFFIYLLYRWPRVGVALCGVLIVTSTTASIMYTALHRMSSVPGVYDYVQDVYIKPQFRISTYLAGILLGHYMVLNKDNITKNKFMMLVTRSAWTILPGIMLVLRCRSTCDGRLGWLCCVACLLFAVFGLLVLKPSVQNAWRDAFNIGSPTIWCIGISWVVYASVAGSGGLVTKFLSSSFFAPLGKLTFAVYISHHPLQFVFFASREESFDYNYFLMGYFFVGNLVFSFAVAAVLTLTIEIPFRNLERLFLGRI